MTRRIELVAEVSSNHGGDLSLAKEFCYRFAEAGADWIKFQMTRVAHLRPSDPQFAWFQRAELSDDYLAQLAELCGHLGVKFLCTINHADEAPILRSFSPFVKIGAGESHERTVRDAVMAQGFQRIYVSNPPENFWRVNKLDSSRATRMKWNLTKVYPLTTVSRYPCPVMAATVNLGHYGWSDHCVGLEGAQLAIVKGARMIEKHVQLPFQGRTAKPYEATIEEFRALRAFADENPSRFIGRWQHVNVPVLA
jgi:sialic acid synthase SpsE